MSFKFESKYSNKTTKINKSKITFLERTNRSINGYNSKILYNKRTPLIETPITTVTFPLKGFTFRNGPKKYTLCIDLNHSIKGMSEFVEFIDSLDEMTRDHLKNKCNENLKTLTQYSCIKPSSDVYKYSDLMRCKLILNGNQNAFRCEVYKNNKIITPSVENVEKLLVNGTRVRLLLQVNPIWKVNDKFGVSLIVKKIQIVDDNELKEQGESLRKYFSGNMN